MKNFLHKALRNRNRSASLYRFRQVDRNQYHLALWHCCEYRWDKNTAPKGTYTYPPEVSKVKPVLEAIKYLWLELYSEPSLGGTNFWKGKAPLKIYLYGGKNIDGNGQELINSSAVGREFHLYNINNFDPRDKNKVYVLMRIVHHQFARLLGDEIYPYDRQAFFEYQSEGLSRKF